MEVNIEIEKFVSAILSLGDKGLLNNLDLSEPVRVLRDVFQRASPRAKSQMTLLMILNSDLSVLSQLENDENVGRFIKFLPEIKKDILLKLIFELNLQSYFHDIVKNCHIIFTREIISAFLEDFKSSDLSFEKYGVESIYQLWSALFVKIHNINQGLDADKSSGILVSYFEEIYNQINLTLLLLFRLRNCINIGTHLHHFLNQLLFFLQMANDENYKFEQDELYEFNLKLENITNEHIENPSLVSISVVFKKLHKIMEYLTLDIWEELDNCFLESNSNCSLSKLIGQTIYRICEEFNNLRPQLSCYVESESLLSLAKYKIKPKSEVELLSEESISNIMSNIDGKRESAKWFKALLFHYNSSYNLVIDCLLRHLNLTDDNDIYFLLENTLKLLQVEKNENSLSNLKRIFFQAFKKTHSDGDNSFWFKKTLDLKPGLLKTETFSCQVIEIYNKLDRYFCINQECDVQKEFVLCCMQSPEETLLKICEIVVNSQNSKQVLLCCRVLCDLKYVCNTSSRESEDLKILEEVILKMVRSEQHFQSGQEDNLFISFLNELSTENLLGFKCFEKILDFMISDLENGRFNEVQFYLEIVESCQPYKLSNFNKSAFLVFMCQILSSISWKPESFFYHKTKKLCHQIISDIMSQLTGEDDGNELEWARQEILKFEEIHQSYFCDLWFKFNRCWSGSGTFISLLLALLYSSGDVESVLMNQKKNLKLEKVSSDIKAVIISNVKVLLLQLCDEHQWRRLDQILTVLLSKYWKTNEQISDNAIVLEIFSSSMYLIALDVNEASSSKSNHIYDCFKFCLRNFGSLTTVDRLSEHDFDDFIDFVEKMTFPVQALENDKQREDCLYIIMFVILKFTKQVSKKTLNEMLHKLKNLARVVDVKFFAEVVDEVSCKVLGKR